MCSVQSMLPMMGYFCAGKLDASAPEVMHAVNAFAKQFQKVPRSELCSQLHQAFGQVPCMVPCLLYTSDAADE